MKQKKMRNIFWYYFLFNNELSLEVIWSSKNKYQIRLRIVVLSFFLIKEPKNFKRIYIKVMQDKDYYLLKKHFSLR